MAAERTEVNRFFDLRLSGFLAPLNDRVVVEWDNPRSWHRSAGSASASRMPVLERPGLVLRKSLQRGRGGSRGILAGLGFVPAGRSGTRRGTRRTS